MLCFQSCHFAARGVSFPAPPCPGCQEAAAELSLMAGGVQQHQSLWSWGGAGTKCSRSTSALLSTITELLAGNSSLAGDNSAGSGAALLISLLACRRCALCKL